MVSFQRTMTPLVKRVLVGLLVALPLAFDSFFFQSVNGYSRGLLAEIQFLIIQ